MGTTSEPPAPEIALFRGRDAGADDVRAF